MDSTTRRVEPVPVATTTPKRKVARQKCQPTPLKVEKLAAEDTSPVPESLRDCLLPLSHAAIQSSVMAYRWGAKNKRLMQAAIAMDLAGAVIKECNEMLAHEASAPVPALPKRKTLYSS